MEFAPFRNDTRLTEVLSNQNFTLSAEIIPPRNGSEQSKILGQIEALIEAGAQFLAVTKGAGGSLRGGSLPIAQSIKERFSIPCIAHFTCRDLTAFEIENQLVDHHYFGIRNILALRGDPPDGQPEWKSKEGGYAYAYQLIEQIRNLNQGVYLQRKGGPAPTASESTQFCIGAAAYPDFPEKQNRIDYFKLKVQAGAEFGITDMLFDPDSYGRFVDDCHKNGLNIPILPGTRFLKTKNQAIRMATKFKVKIPASTLEALPEEDGPEAIQIGLELFYQLTQNLKRLGAPGVHLYVISDTEGASLALRRLAISKKQDKE
jgi:methylenetetrahydrofolate reductase (NADPH)